MWFLRVIIITPDQQRLWFTSFKHQYQYMKQLNPSICKFIPLRADKASVAKLAV